MVAMEAIRSANKAFKETPGAEGLVGLFGRFKAFGSFRIHLNMFLLCIYAVPRVPQKLPGVVPYICIPKNHSSSQLAPVSLTC